MYGVDMVEYVYTSWIVWKYFKDFFNHSKKRYIPSCQDDLKKSSKCLYDVLVYWYIGFLTKSFFLTEKTLKTIRNGWKKIYP